MAIEDNTTYGLKGSQVKDLATQVKKRAASVNNDGASHVEYTNQIYTETLQFDDDSFLFRTTAGSTSIETGEASLLNIKGNCGIVGHVDEVLVMTTSFADPNTIATIDRERWWMTVHGTGTKTFAYDGVEWKDNGSSVNLTTYGITVTGTATSGDTITVVFSAEVPGYLGAAKPTSFVATGFNQYDATAGYAHVKGENEYRIDGTYTSLKFSKTVGGTKVPITVTDDRFTPTEDGYIYITGGVGDILIALVWSGIMNSEPFTAYETSSITIPTADMNGTPLPTASYGMPRVEGVADEISFADKTYTQRIGQYAYTVENLATVQALNTPYIYDETNIFYVLDTPVVYQLNPSINGNYIANDFGTEEFVGSDLALEALISYGNNLVDKLRNLLNIQSTDISLRIQNGELSLNPMLLTKEHYNYDYGNTGANNCVALWKLEPGRFYIWGAVSVTTSDDTNIRVLPARTNISAYSDLSLGRMFGGVAVMPPSGGSETTVLYLLGRGVPINSVGSTGAVIRVASDTGSAYTPVYTLDSTSLVDNLNSNDSGRPLAATQGKVLGLRIMAKSDTAPTTTTVGVLGGLLPTIESGTPHLYMCTDITGSSPNRVYTWIQLV